MKIKSHSLNNFQNHKKSFLNFDPCVNIISGNSRNGKSAILRSLRWNFLNKPSGDSFIPLDDPQALTSVTTEFDDFSITHERSEKVHSYKLSKEDEQVFRKFGQTVPDVISNELDLADHNIQSQHAQYFLLQDTGSDVAEKLNKIAGLEVIDRTLSNINSYVRKVSSNIDLSKEQIRSYEERVNELSFLDKAEVLINDIDECYSESNNIEEKIKALTTLITTIEDLERKKALLNEKVKHKEKVKELKSNIDIYDATMLKYADIKGIFNNIVKMNEQCKIYTKKTAHKDMVSVTLCAVNDLNTVNDRLTSLTGLVNSSVKLQSTLEELNEWLKVKDYNTKIINLIDNYNLCVIKVREIPEIMNDISNLEKSIKSVERKRLFLKEKKKDYLNKMGQCPLCGRS